MSCIMSGAFDGALAAFVIAVLVQFNGWIQGRGFDWKEVAIETCLGALLGGCFGGVGSALSKLELSPFAFQAAKGFGGTIVALAIMGYAELLYLMLMDVENHMDGSQWYPSGGRPAGPLAE
jgi:hypothetical protein